MRAACFVKSYYLLNHGVHILGSLKFIFIVIILNNLAFNVNCDPSSSARVERPRYGGNSGLTHTSSSSRSNHPQLQQTIKAHHAADLALKPKSIAKYPVHSQNARAPQVPKANEADEPAMISFPDEAMIKTTMIKDAEKSVDKGNRRSSQSQGRSMATHHRMASNTNINPGSRSNIRTRTRTLTSASRTTTAPKQKKKMSSFYTRPKDSIDSEEIVLMKRNVNADMDMNFKDPKRAYIRRKREDASSDILSENIIMPNMPTRSRSRHAIYRFTPKKYQKRSVKQVKPGKHMYNSNTQVYRNGGHLPVIDQNFPLGENHPMEVLFNLKYELHKLENQIFEANLWNEKVIARRQEILG